MFNPYIFEVATAYFQPPAQFSLAAGTLGGYLSLVHFSLLLSALLLIPTLIPHQILIL